MGRSSLVLLAMLMTSVCGCGAAAASPETSDADGGVDAGDDGEAGELPCAVASVLGARCQECHGNPPAHSAPFPLVTYADTQADYFGKPVWKRMQNAIDAGFMPPIPKAPLSEEDKATMLDWLDHGAPPAGPGEACP